MTKFSEANDELLKRISEGDESAREEIIEQNIGLVRSIVKRFLGRGHEAEDLFQIGCIGLIKAVNKFDRSYGVTFSTYAVPMIIGEIKRFIRDDGIIKVSRAYKDISYKAFTVKERMMAEQKTEPTLAEIANELNITPQELSTAMEAARSPESLYAQTDEKILPDNTYMMSGNNISVKTLNLNCAFSEIAFHLNEIADNFMGN